MSSVNITDEMVQGLLKLGVFGLSEGDRKREGGSGSHRDVMT